MRHRDETSLVGWYFQSFAIYDPGIRKVEWQGRVIGRPEPGWYLVQFCSRLDKSEPMIKLVKFEKMSHWEFYPDSDLMMEHYGKLENQYICPRCKNPGIPSVHMGTCTSCANLSRGTGT